MELEFLHETTGIYNTIYQAGERIKYRPWTFEWHGMTEPERVSKGIFVHCYGHGEFEIYHDGQDIKIV
jgi:hypothetical protein